MLVVQIVVALVAVAGLGLSILNYRRSQQDRQVARRDREERAGERERRRLLPPPELSIEVQDLLYDLGTITASGGRESLWFLDEERQRRRMRLRAMIPGIVDPELHQLVAAADGDYQDCWARSVGHGQTKHTREHIERARSGQKHAMDALTRIGKLTFEAA